MFHCVDARLQVIQAVCRIDRHLGAGDDRPGVHFRYDPMHHDAGVVDLAPLKRLVGALDGVGAGELAGQGGMQIEHLHRKAIQKRRAEHVHPAGQHDQVRVIASHRLGQIGVVVGAWPVAVRVGLEGKVQR